MTKVPLSLRLTIGLVLVMIGTLLAGEMQNHHYEHLTTLITLITHTVYIVNFRVSKQWRSLAAALSRQSCAVDSSTNRTLEFLDENGRLTPRPITGSHSRRRPIRREREGNVA